MNKTIVYMNSAVELSEIFRYLDDSIKSRIPNEIIEHYNRIKNNDYIFELDKSVTLDKQKLMPETKSILGYIYLKYCCEEEERNRIIRESREHRKMMDDAINSKYNFDLLRNNDTQVKEEKAETGITVINKEHWYIKLIQKIKSFFGITRK